MKYNILDGAGKVVNTVIASSDAYMTEHYGTGWERVVEIEVVTPRPAISKLAFLDLLTNDEYVAILVAADMSPVVRAWVEKFKLAEDVKLDDQRTKDGITALEKAGILAPGRAAQILGD